MQKYYAVRIGKNPGIYNTWAECKAQVDGFVGARYKSFTSLSEAEDFIKNDTYTPKTKKETSKKFEYSNLDDFELVVYTDGGSRNHGNVKGGHVLSSDKAAWAYLIKTSNEKIEDSDGEFGATNNKMEITALIESIKKINNLELNDKKVIFILDSQYVLNAIIKGWLVSWKANGYKKSDGKVPANLELWKELDELLPTIPNKSFEWTKGHDNDAGNNRVDELLNLTMDRM
ncbi:ribonuclease H family protein [Companilactobacillus metriopterae]|uniref:ribonuclease H family protein n=1 Tax=Companilactobacillus metriopterae TaxID=1909267 RepID=UPI00100B2E23|nr:ribonuclease H family protein [Companilactobacillus metriopterae]